MTRKLLTRLLWLGIGLQVAAGLLWSLSFADGQTVGGAAIGYLGTIALAAAGSSLVFVGLVGWGALLALRAHGEEVASRANSSASVEVHSARLRG